MGGAGNVKGRRGGEDFSRVDHPHEGYDTILEGGLDWPEDVTDVQWGGKKPHQALS